MCGDVTTPDGNGAPVDQNASPVVNAGTNAGSSAPSGNSLLPPASPDMCAPANETATELALSSSQETEGSCDNTSDHTTWQ